MRWAQLFLFMGLIGTATLTYADEKVVKSTELSTPRPFVNQNDGQLLKHAPKSGLITTAQSWSNLWKVWGGEKDPPAVDFEKEFVLVAAGSGPNIINIEDLQLNDKGDLKFRYSVTECAGNGFTVKFLKLSRVGIKTVNGKELPKE